MKIIELDEKPFDCPYLKGLRATYQHFITKDVTPHERLCLLNEGYRFFGAYCFRPKCESCNRCVPLRIPVEDFKISKSQRKVLNKCKKIRVEVGEATYTAEKLQIYKDHSKRFESPDQNVSIDEFKFSFYDDQVPKLEFCYYLDKILVGVGIVHNIPTALSSAYFSYRRSASVYSLGTFSILKEIEHAKEMGKKHLYLGYYIKANHFMAYKGEFRPNEILLSNYRWKPFRDESGENILGYEPEFNSQFLR